MPFEPISPLGGFTGGFEPQEPPLFTDINPETRGRQPEQPGLMDAAFRTENTVGSSVASEEVRYARESVGVFGGPVKIDPDFDPWAEIADTPYERYSEQFAVAGNKQHFDAIRADIDRETKDRQRIADSGIVGMGAAMAAGVLDLPTLLPGGAIVRTAKGVSLLRTAGVTAVAGGVAGGLSELALQGTQQLRAAEESAAVIGGSVVLSGLLGAGFGKLFSRGEQAALAARIERDFRVPGPDDADPYTPGSFKVETAPGASDRATQVAEALQEAAEGLGLRSPFRVQVADSIDLADGGKFGLRGATPTEVKVFHGTTKEFETTFDAAQSRFDGDFYLTTDPYLTDRFTGTHLNRRYAANEMPIFVEGGRVIPAFIETKNFKSVDMEGYVWRDDGGERLKAEVDQAKSEGYEGLRATNVRDEGVVADQYVAWTKGTVRSAITDDQLLSMRGGVAEGHFDPETLLITISADALDPVKTLKHETIHALRSTGLFKPKEWATLEAAAKKQGWMESHNVRALYEELYSGRGVGDMFSMRQPEFITDTAALSRGVAAHKDLADELLENGAKITKDGNVLLYHRTTQKQLDEILRTGKMTGKEDGLFFSTKKDGQISDYGEAALEVYVPLSRLQLDDVFGTEAHVRIPLKRPGDVIDVSEFLSKGSPGTSSEGSLSLRGKFSVRGSGKASTSRLDPKLENLLLEEAIAEQFSLWRQGALQVTGTIAKLFQKMQDFLERIGNALRGRGFQTADDVFAAVDAGRVAGRMQDTLPGLPGAAGVGAGAGHVASVGAAARDTVDNTLKGAFGLEKMRIDPMIYLQNSKSEKAKLYVQELAETPLAYKKNAEGMETAPLGSEMGEPGSVESRIKGWQAPLAEGVQTLENAFMRYRKGRDKLPLDQLRMTIGDAISKPEKLTWREFKAEVARAARRGDAHPIPEVAQAAKFARQTVFNPLKDRAIAKELLPEDISAETAESYLNRLYNKEKIISRRPEFRAIVTKWLDEVEFRNQVTRAQLAPLLKRMDELQEAAKAAAKPKAGAKKQPIDPAQAEAAAAKAAEDKAEMTELQESIEALVLKYEGKTKAEAESAVKAREKGEAGRDPEAKRLTAADKPIIRAARKIAAQVDKEAGETASLADEIIDRILGTPDGRLPYDAHLTRTTDSRGISSSARGPLAGREFMIPDDRIEDFLENDFEMLMHAYVRTMAPDIELHARFGDVDMKLQFKEILEDWARKASAATSEKERRNLHAQRDGDIRRLAAIRDRLRGTYALPSNPDGLLLRTGRVMRSVNYTAMLGGQVISAIPDMGSIVFSHGIMRTFGDGIIPLFRNFSGARLAAREVKLAGTALDMVLDSRAMNIGEIMDDYGRHTKFERGVQAMARSFGPISLMSPWNAAMKQTAGLITMSRIIRASDALARGVIKKPDLERLAASGISRQNAIKIAEQFKKHGEKDGGVFLPKTENWDKEARAAKEAFRAALVREVDKTIITPGQEKWLWMSTELGKTLGQFKSFSVSANQRLLIAGLQQSDMATLSGAALMVTLGGLVHIIKTKASGREPGIDWSDNEKTSQFMVNAVDRSGLLGWLMEANALTEKMTAGAVGISKLTGRPISRYASRNAIGALAGPTFGTLQSIGQVTSSGFSQWSESDTRAARRLIPYQNLFFLRSIFDKAEAGANSFFGVPKSATRH
jgi:hypothetical protein